MQMEEQGKKPLDLGIDRDNPAVDELAKLGYIRRDVDHIHLLIRERLRPRRPCAATAWLNGYWLMS